jgi:trimethylamine:corrinoid methyltransferase-like protein
MAQSFAAVACPGVHNFAHQGDIELMAQAVVDIAPADWARFEAWVNEPSRHISALADLARYSLPPVHGR